MNPRTIAIGDIHGCSTALKHLLQRIQPQSDDTIITLGDAIDRGPDSRGVIEQLIELREQCHLIPLLGNHEEMFLAARQSRSEFIYWTQYGGLNTLDSYGPHSTWDDIPPAHFRFLKSCQPFFETDGHIFVHANYDPVLPMAQQPDRLLRWEHLDPARILPHASGKRVIVGHTPQMDGKILDLGFVIGIDTGCGLGGPLTALNLINGHVWQANQQGEVREWTGRSTNTK